MMHLVRRMDEVIYFILMTPIRIWLHVLNYFILQNTCLFTVFIQLEQPSTFAIFLLSTHFMFEVTFVPPHFITQQPRSIPTKEHKHEGVHTQTHTYPWNQRIATGKLSWANVRGRHRPSAVCIAIKKTESLVKRNCVNTVDTKRFTKLPVLTCEFIWVYDRNHVVITHVVRCVVGPSRVNLPSFKQIKFHQEFVINNYFNEPVSVPLNSLAWRTPKSHQTATTNRGYCWFA